MSENEWVALHAPSEGETPADDGCPWYPYLFCMSGGSALDIHFSTEGECLEFIRNVIGTAKFDS